MLLRDRRSRKGHKGREGCRGRSTYWGIPDEGKAVKHDCFGSVASEEKMELLFPAPCAVEGQDRTGDAGEGSSTVSRSQTHSWGKK